METDNAASRLLALLSEAKKIDPTTTSSNAWRKLLRTKDPSLLLSRLGKMIALPEEISSTLSNSVNTSPEVLSHISRQFYSAFSAHKFSEKWESFSRQIDAHIINYLELASTLLETQAKTKRLEDGELEELRRGFTELLERTRSSDLSPRIKAYVTRQLHELISALDDYFITGAEPILERIEAAVGHAHIDAEYNGFLKDSELGKSLLNCLAAAANVVTVAVGIPQLTNLIQLLEHSN